MFARIFFWKHSMSNKSLFISITYIDAKHTHTDYIIGKHPIFIYFMLQVSENRSNAKFTKQKQKELFNKNTSVADHEGDKRS